MKAQEVKAVFPKRLKLMKRTDVCVCVRVFPRADWPLSRCTVNAAAAYLLQFQSRWLSCLDHCAQFKGDRMDSTMKILDINQVLALLVL